MRFTIDRIDHIVLNVKDVEIAAACDFIVRRDPKGFRGSPVRHLTPEALLPLLARAPNQL